MKCIFCGAETHVTDKRESSDGTRRRRECLKCKKRYTTYEKIGSINLIVLKKDGRKETFDSEKLKKGILIACEKRPVTVEQIDEVVNKIEAELRKLKSKEILSSTIGEKVLARLKKLDEIAYMRFLSVFRSFNEVEDFKKELKKLKGEK